MKATLLLFIHVTARIGACGYCSWHMTHFKHMLGFEVTVWFLFFIYQLLKLAYFLKAENFGVHAQQILRWLNFAFFALVVLSCGLELVNVIAKNPNDTNAIIQAVFLFFIKIIIYIIIELIGEVIYTLKINRLQNNDTDKATVLKQSLVNLFDWLSIFIPEAEQPIAESEVKQITTKLSAQPKVKLRPSIAITQKERIEKYLRKRRNRRKNRGKK